MTPPGYVGFVVPLEHPPMVCLSLIILRRIEQKSEPLLRRLEQINDTERKRLMEFKSLHDAVSVASSYRGIVLGTISVLIPFVPLITMLLKSLIGDGKPLTANYRRGHGQSSGD
jgi:hypothetical protein